MYSHLVAILQIQRRVISVRYGSSWRGGGGAGAVLSAVREALFRRAQSEGGGAHETLPRYTLRTWVHQVSTHKTLQGSGLTIGLIPKRSQGVCRSSLMLPPCVSCLLQRSDYNWDFPPSALRGHRLRSHGHFCRLPQQCPVLSGWRLPQCLHQAVRSLFAHLLNDFFFLVYSCTRTLLFALCLQCLSKHAIKCIHFSIWD